MRRILFAVLGLYLAAATAWAGEGFWSADRSDPGDDVQWVGASITNGNTIAAINYYYANQKWAVLASIPYADRVDQILSRIVEKGENDLTLTLPREKLIVDDSNIGGGFQVVAFTISPEDVAYYQRADAWILEVGGQQYRFPLTGSRAALNDVIAVLQAPRSGTGSAGASDPGRAYAALEVCRVEVAHPWDENSPVDGVEWEDITPSSAVSACEEAVALNEETPELLYLMGRAYNKAGDERGYEFIFNAAINKGYGAAYNHLGIFYEDGEGFPKNLNLAERYYGSAARKGNIPGAYNEARLQLQEGRPVEERLKARFKMLEVAARDYSRAQYWAGRSLMDETLPGYDPVSARKWYLRAASQNHAPAALRLAWIYRDGIGTAPDPVEYLKWLKVSADNGNTAARKELGLE